jgi:hypothetical protein
VPQLAPEYPALQLQAQVAPETAGVPLPLQWLAAVLPEHGPAEQLAPEYPAEHVQMQLVPDLVGEPRLLHMFAAAVRRKCVDGPPIKAAKKQKRTTTSKMKTISD